MTSFAWILLLQWWAGTELAAPFEAADARGLAAPGEGEAPAPKPAPKPDEPPATPKKKAGPSCRLPSEEGPRGGRLIVEGDGFGRTPVVRIGDRITRILSRLDRTVSVQIPADSDGGPVTVEADGVRAACGWLTIVGKDR